MTLCNNAHWSDKCTTSIGWARCIFIHQLSSASTRCLSGGWIFIKVFVLILSLSFRWGPTRSVGFLLDTEAVEASTLQQLAAHEVAWNIDYNQDEKFDKVFGEMRDEELDFINKFNPWYWKEAPRSEKKTGDEQWNSKGNAGVQEM